jgi:hypothetical protein
MFRASPGKKNVYETPPKWKKAGHVCYHSDGRKHKIKGSQFRLI